MNKLARLLKFAFNPTFYYELYRCLLYYSYEHISPLSKIKRGENFEMHPSVSIRFGENIFMGNNVVVDAHCCLWASKNSRISIGNNVALGQCTSLISSNHKFDKKRRFSEQEMIEKDIAIGDDVWIGCNSVILCGVTVGKGSIIGAGSVISKNIPEYSVVLGNSREFVLLPRR